MEIKTASGCVYLNKRKAYTKWVLGWRDGGGYDGWSTLQTAWDNAKNDKPNGCSWYAYGLLMAREQSRGRELEQKEIYG